MRGSGHEHRICELSVGPDGVVVGEPFAGLDGVLTGRPVPYGTDRAGAPTHNR
jgi:hypothetical protein